MSTAQARRFAVVALSAVCAVFSAAAEAQTKVRFAEVARSLLFTPFYVAVSKGYFKDAGLEVSITTIPGGDKTMAALLSNTADVGLMGPEAAIYVWNSESSVKAKMFAGLTTTDGFVLMSRQKIARFDWKMLKGKELLAFRPGSSPLLFLESAMRKNGVDPRKDVKLLTNVPYPARVGAWLSASSEFGIFDEPAASQLEKDGKAFPIVPIGREVGAADYTAFMATDRYIKEHPAVIQSWTNAMAKALKWTESAQTAEVVKVLVEFFPGIEPQLLGAAVERYKGIRIWKSSPLIEPQPIRRFEDILVEGGVLENSKRVKFENLVATEFAQKVR